MRSPQLRLRSVASGKRPRGAWEHVSNASWRQNSSSRAARRANKANAILLPRDMLQTRFKGARAHLGGCANGVWVKRPQVRVGTHWHGVVSASQSPPHGQKNKRKRESHGMPEPPSPTEGEKRRGVASAKDGRNHEAHTRKHPTKVELPVGHARRTAAPGMPPNAVLGKEGMAPGPVSPLRSFALSSSPDMCAEFATRWL